MDPISLRQISEFAEGSLIASDGELPVSRVSTDSRTLQAGDLFVPLRGENFDGHKFIGQAAERGAVGAMVEESWKGAAPKNFALIRVRDTLAGYQTLAANYRKSLPLKVIAITGSNGKTSTKDFVAATLSRGFRVTKTEGNFNNHVGLPQTMLAASSSDEIAVWEIGMNHPGEIAALAKLAVPDAAIITNIGLAHIEFMGSRDAIAAEKGSLAEAVGGEGTVILNADDPYSQGIAERTSAKVILAGIENGFVRATEVRPKREWMRVHDPGRRAPLPGPTACPRNSYGAKRDVGGRGWPRIRPFAGGVRGWARLRSAHQSASPNQGDQRHSVHRR